MLQKFQVCPVTDIAEGMKKRLVVNGKALMVAQVEGKFYATDDTCTHAQASMTAGVLEGHEVECPRHGSRFDIRTGEALSLPAVMPLATYKVLVEDGKIFVEMAVENTETSSVQEKNESMPGQTNPENTPDDSADAPAEKKADAKPPFEVVCEGGVCRIIRPKKA